MTQYGYFDDANREYVITNPRTPVRWTNYIGSLAFGGQVDHTGGGVLCAGDPGLNRIVKYIPQLPASDFNGQTLYIRLREGAGYRVFSPFFVPTLDDYESYECHVGMGYMRVVSVFHGIRTDATIFVPPGAHAEIRDIKVANLRKAPVELDLVPVVEFSHFDALKQFTNADWVPQTMMADAIRQPDGHVVLVQYPFLRKKTLVNYLASNRPVDSFETDRSLFLGHNDYGTWKAPASLLGDHLSNTEARRGNVIGALLHAMGTIQPGAEVRLITQLGQAHPGEVEKSVANYRNEAAVDAAFARNAAFWEDYLARCTCETPDAAFNSMVNVHNPRQCFTTMNWSRYLSLYQLGLGSRGMGFRDTSQDVMGALAGAPAQAKDLLRKLLSVQNPDGSAMHQFYPFTMEASSGDAAEEGGSKQIYGDDHLWIVLAVCAYLKETADLAFLDEEITFYRKDVPLAEREAAPVLEHLRRALAYSKRHVGRHGLPLLGFADWNDTVNLPGDAESLFNANLYGRALLEMIDLYRHLGWEEKAEVCARDHGEMKARVEQHAWDGAWYVRYFTEDGEPIGSSRNDKGKIYTNGQSWPVLSGFASEERARAALDSVHRLLNTSNGIKLSAPGYDAYDPEIGGVTTYPPGAKENGGIFLHSNPWVMIAETLLGNGDRAFEYYNQINPAAKNDRIDEYECEPYCYAQNILGDEHPQFGLGRNSWLSGTSSWTYQAATQYILGIRPRHHGLEIDPCIPRAWDGFRVTRQFRGATYAITVRNPEHRCKGVASVTVDGEPLSDAVVPVFGDGKVHTVEVVLGENRMPRENVLIETAAESNAAG